MPLSPGVHHFSPTLSLHVFAATEPGPTAIIQAGIHGDEVAGVHALSEMLEDELRATDQRIADLNAEFRGKPAPTNVLSWPAEDCAAKDAPHVPADGFLGDLAFARETIETEAEKQHLDPETHFAHLFCHGVLHLMGYDHQTEADAEVMEGAERGALARLGIADPYAPKDE